MWRLQCHLPSLPNNLNGRETALKERTMICKQCKQAFNGTAGICHSCGTVHPEPKKAVEKIMAIPEPDLSVEKESDPPKPEKKKKGGK